MNKYFSLAVIFAAFLAAASANAREVISINEGWTFSKSISTGAAVDQFHRLDVFGVEMPLLANHQNAVALLPAVVHPIEAFRRVGHRLFTENVLSGMNGIHGHLGVQGEGRADDDSFHLLVVEELAVVGIFPGPGEQGGGLLQVRGIVVAEGDNTGRRIL